MAISAQSILPSQAAPAADGKPSSTITNGIEKENFFYSALQDLLLNGAGAAPTAGQAVLSAAEKGGKNGQNSPEDGKDLPLALAPEASPAVIGLIPPVAVTGVIPPDSDGASVTLSGQDGEALSAADLFKTATQGGNQSAFMLSSNSRREANVASSADAPKGETTMGMTADSDDALAAMLDKIMLGRETTPAASGQGISSANSVVLRDSASPTQQQVLTQPFTDLMAGARGVASHNTSAASTPVAVPFNQPGWDQALGERVHWMVTQRLQAAEIHLNPPELGPVEVRLSMDQNQARIQFLSPHASVRDAIEAALPRLREMLGDGGVQLMNVDVGQHSAERQSHFHAGFGDAHRGPVPWFSGTNGGDDTILSASTTAIPALGLVDYYV